jgi:hypothetical protein
MMKTIASIYFKRDNCRLCHGRNLEKVMDYVATPVGDHFVAKGKLGEPQDTYPLDLYFCADCGQLQLLDVVNPEFIYKDYLYETAVSMGLVEHFQKYAADLIERMKLSSGDTVVEIGCNDGSFLKCFHDRGLKALGVEPASAIAAKAANKGLNILNTFFTFELSQTIKGQHGAAKMIIANNVMANVEDMHGFMKGVSDLLAGDGIFVFESGYAVDTLKNSVMDNVYHEHLCYFRLNPLIKFFKKHGLEVIDAERVETKGGSLRGIAQKIGGRRPVSPRVKERMEMEEKAGLETAAFYHDFARRMEAARADLVKLLTQLKKEGKSIAGYGASVGVTTLLYYYGANKFINVLYDDNPIKQGLYSPGHHILVRPSAEIYKDNPDYILCFPWRYKEPIMKRHSAFRDKGGKFIVPLPKVEVL